MKQTADLNDWIEVLESQGAERGDQVSFGYSSNGELLGQQITFAELATRAKSLAVTIRQQVAQGERALLLMPNGIDYVVGFFACIYAGVLAVPAYPPQQRRRDWGRLASIAHDCQASLVLCVSTHADKVTQWRADESLDCALVQVDLDQGQDADTWQKPDIQSEDIVFLQYSSGSTGSPKGVMLSHRNLLENADLIRRQFGFDAECQCVSWLPMYHDMGMVGYVLTPVLAGAPVYLLPPPLVIQNPYAWLKVLSQFERVISGGPNFIFDHCVDRINETQKKALNLSGWQAIPNGAEPILPQTLDRFYQAFATAGLSDRAMKPSYGMAEACLFVAATAFDKAWQKIASEATEEGVCSGELHPNIPVKIVDPSSLTEVSEGIQGEICFKGVSISSGYWGKPELNKQVFNLTISGEDGFFRSGDLGFVVDGQLCVNGRLKEMLIVNGVNHFPQDIEVTVQGVDEDLASHAGAVFAMPAANGQSEQVVVVQELSRQGARRKDLSELVSAIRQTVAEVHELSLSSVVLISPASLAKTTSGKIQRLKCRELHQQSELNVIYQWQAQAKPQASSELVMPPYPNAAQVLYWLQSWIAQRIGVVPHEVAEDSELAALGLDSIDAMTLMHDLEQALQTPISQELMWQAPSLAAFAQAVVSESSSTLATEVEESLLEGEI